MLIRVQGASFKQVMETMLKAGKCHINFEVNNNKLYMQRIGLVYIEETIDIIEVDDVSESITIMIDPVIKVLSDAADVFIYVIGDLCRIVQGSFELSAARVNEDRVKTDVETIKMNGVYSKGSLLANVSCAKSLDGVQRDNNEVLSDVTISGMKAYTTYSNAMLQTELKFPNMTIQGETIRELSRFISMEGDSAYYFDSEKELLYLTIGINTVAVVPVKSVNPQVAGTFDKILGNLKHCTNIRISDVVDTISVICANYKKQTVELTICNGGVRIYVDNLVTKFGAGSSAVGLFSMKVSTSQLSAIAKLFGAGSNEIEVLKGDNIICLKHGNYNERLMLAGMIY
jgi:hypothetical protein